MVKEVMGLHALGVGVQWLAWVDPQASPMPGSTVFCQHKESQN